MVMKLKYDERGLIPAIVQDFYTKEILTLAYMNRESLEITIREGKTCFWSRSRKELWRKGETSGNYQKVVNIKADCDADALVIEVIKAGPACHTGKESCFFDEIYQSEEYPGFSYQKLIEQIEDRKLNPKKDSYTTYLFREGMDKILKKIGEESTEVIIAAAKGDKEETIYELADLIYHGLVMMIESGIELRDVTGELVKRHVVDEKKKQQYMGGSK